MNRIKFLREEKGIYQKDLAKLLNVSIPAINYYENEKRAMDTETASILANYFGVSIDYLLGKSNVRNTSTIDFSKDELHIALSAEDKGYISEDVKKAIENYAKFVIEEEKKKEEKKKEEKKDK